MAKAIALRDYYNRKEAFYDSDPMIRIAAIHHASGKLDRNPSLREILRNLLNDKDLLVSRYAAISLGQSGDATGLRHLLQAISSAQGSERQELEACLRNCSRFPFAVVLNELVYLESISDVADVSYKEFLKNTLYLTSDRFYEKTEEDPSFRDQFLRILRVVDRVKGLRVRGRKICDVGWILAPPRGKQPGFLFCPDRAVFLKFQDDVVVNRESINVNKQVIFVTAEKPHYCDTDCLYVFEDTNTARDSLSALISKSLMAHAEWFGLVPGVVVAKRDNFECADVVTIDGKHLAERYRSQKASLSQFVLVEETTDLGRPQCHFVPDVFLESTVTRDIIRRYVDVNKLVLGQVSAVDSETHSKSEWLRCTLTTESGIVLTGYLPRPRERAWVVMETCSTCGKTGDVTCEECAGRGNKACSGDFMCPKCHGDGLIENSRRCIFCSGTGRIMGCGSRRNINCPACNGAGSIKCDRCGGDGCQDDDCPKCGGRGYYGSGECWTCNGSGLAPCRACRGEGSRECFYCRGDKVVQCPVCNGRGLVPCRRCKGKGKITCPGCNGNGLTFSFKIGVRI